MKRMIILVFSLVALAAVVLVVLHEENFLNLENYAQIAEEKREEEHSSDQAPETNESEHEEEQIVKLDNDQIARMGLQLQTVNPGTMLLTLSTRGKVILDPDHLAHVIPKISGIVKEVRKHLGSYVRKGDILAILESQEMADLKAAYLAAVSKERLAASVLARESRLYQKGISAGQDFFNARNAYEEARIQWQLASQKLQALGIHQEDIQRLLYQRNPNLSTYPIYAPLDGLVIMRHLTQGEYVENNTTIYEIADFSHVWVEVGIYPKDLPRIREGQMVEVISPDTHQATEAQLIYISPILANETITAKAIALVDNPHGNWRPGTFVKVNIATKHIACPLVISKEAIQKIEGKDCAFVMTNKGFEKRELQLGQEDAHHVEVLSGLLSGEQYVAHRSFLLKAEMNKALAKDDD